MEVRELLSQYDFPGDDTSIVRGSALQALNGVAEWEGRFKLANRRYLHSRARTCY